MRILAFLCLGLSLTAIALAEEPGPTPSPSSNAETKSLYDTPLEDLLKIQVYTASKQAESVEKSPAVMSIVTQKEIESYGALNLGDVLDRVTSLYLVGTLPLPSGMLSIRGDVTPEENNHVLILLNGRPVRDSIFSGLNEEVYTAFPVASVRQIEVTRGPGSVLYGTNAFVGVINIITKEATGDTVEPTLRYGTFNSKQVEAFAAHRFGDLELSGGLSYFNNDGWNFTAADWNTANATSTTQSQLQYTHAVGATLLARYKKFALNTYVGSEQLPFMSETSSDPRWALSGTHQATRVTIDLGYEDALSDSWKHTINVTYNRLSVLNSIVGSSNDAASNDALVEWAHYFKLAPRWKALAGLIYTKQTGSGVDTTTSQVTIPNYNDDLWTMYAQLDYQPIDSLHLTAGGQAIKVPDNSLQFVPRLAAIFSFSPSLGVKALYSSAYRAPSEAERHLVLYQPNLTVNVGNPDLSPETIGTMDLQVFYTSKVFQAAVTYFHSRELQLIDQVNLAGAPKYINIGNNTTQGMELEGKLTPADQWSVQAALTYQGSITDNGLVDDGHIPNIMTKLGITYHWKLGVDIGVFDSFYESPKQVDNGHGLTHNVNPLLQYYNYLSANIVFAVNKLANLRNFPETEVQLFATNLFDEQIYYPEYVYGTINSFPGRPGRAVYGAVRMKF